jgi:hypothetical protein
MSRGTSKQRKHSSHNKITFGVTNSRYQFALEPRQKLGELKHLCSQKPFYSFPSTLATRKQKEYQAFPSSGIYYLKTLRTLPIGLDYGKLTSESNLAGHT